MNPKETTAHNTGLIRTFFRALKSKAYTEVELARVRDVLAALGYVHKPEGVYEQDAFSHLLEDYVKVNDEGEQVGVVTLHIDLDGKGMVQDGIMNVTKDDVLARLVGRTTTVSAFALMFQPVATDQLGARISKVMGRQP